jgi:outer membrane lipoprotein SlyB
MKKVLLIATTLMALAIPAHASQISQADQYDQADASEQIQTVTTTSLKCVYTPKPRCY